MRKLIRKILREIYDPRGGKINTSKYVYHVSSPSNRKNILEYGLIPNVGNCYSDWVGQISDENDCEPAIFATDGGKEYWFDTTFDDDVWRIDTKIANVDWYMDIHFDFGRDKHIVTFQNIPPSALKLIHEGSGEDLINYF